MRSRAGLVIVTGVLVLLVGPCAERPAHAKSAIYEIQARCPCPGPTVRTFWTSKDDRLACVDAVLDDLRGQGWPDEILVRDRVREERSRCGDPRFQCDGTPDRRCPARMLCEVLDPNCSADGATGTCVARTKRWRSCRNDPAPVCGCNGRTYASECRLRHAGVAMAHGNTCEVECGGPGHVACGAGEYCYSLPTCDGADARGVCLPIGSTTCDFSVEALPVCGCDGQTHASLCALATANVAFKHGEACEGE